MLSLGGFRKPINALAHVHSSCSNSSGYLLLLKSPAQLGEQDSQLECVAHMRIRAWYSKGTSGMDLHA